MNKPEKSGSSEQSAATAAFEESLAADPDDPRWRQLEFEIAHEQLQWLRESMAQTSERIELLTAELRMLPWNWARAIRDARHELTVCEAALAAARQHAEEEDRHLQAVSRELAETEARLRPGHSDRRSKGLGLLIRRQRRHDGTLLDLRMCHALASQRLQEALERLHLARSCLQVREQSLSDLLAGRRRQRTILIEEIETLRRSLQGEQAQYREIERIVADFEPDFAIADEDSTAPA